ncbi:MULTISPECIES: Hcp family type VI secretion system effector [Photorhabdus]|uniref:Type VI secretion system tube protein Hcp n=2 Tax=Photorhabdus TaxID=29487 RepID=A0A329VBB0_9GAMM|nr:MULTISPECIES: type VI secretion system tube protein Hcp [Photorhabdus]PQQ36023.1 type VI secretion system tube protein Hcp [Photorhabdus luminescens]NDK99527.1 type VI secretion system tube protein Hcp [Photorhabdus bodei]NDL03855.1 type VI secretion system tube protein Hcp [Photorhabdus bodei]NDL07906.1 type VI secretion system tube protein Hcp [Photorhabdus bodei]RAW84433.1 type VI secretion system tube protein Hcp [Photorhabdus laumondii subsp. clarkei]
MNNSIYLDIKDVSGECKDSNHPNGIDVHTFEWKLSQPVETGSGGGGGSGRAKVHSLVVYARMDKAMPTLMQKLAQGVHLPEIKLTMRKAGGEQQEFTTITLGSVLLDSIELVDFNRDIPHLTEGSAAIMPGTIGVKYSFSPNIAKVVYKEQDNEGKSGADVEFNWDTQKNTSK